MARRNHSDPLETLRALFLEAGQGVVPDYWNNSDVLEAYERFFGARILWKWQAVWREAAARNVSREFGRVIDFGCGPGTAALSALQWGSVQEFLLFDRSPAALKHAERRLREAGFSGTLRTTTRWPDPRSADVLLVSHVLNELSAEDSSSLFQLASHVPRVFWTEAATRDVSRRLAEFRDQPEVRSRVLAPCVHTDSCPLFTAANTNHWCHNFATTPSSVFGNAEWMVTSKKLGVDLRSTPYSFLILGAPGAQVIDPGLGRVVGRPKFEKGRTFYYWCDASGLSERRIIHSRDRDFAEWLEELDSHVPVRAASEKSDRPSA